MILVYNKATVAIGRKTSIFLVIRRNKSAKIRDFIDIG